MLKEITYSGFIRPSGTEDVVRIYAEAETQVWDIYPLLSIMIFCTIGVNWSTCSGCSS